MSAWAGRLYDQLPVRLEVTDEATPALAQLSWRRGDHEQTDRTLAAHSVTVLNTVWEEHEASRVDIETLVAAPEGQIALQYLSLIHISDQSV